MSTSDAVTLLFLTLSVLILILCLLLWRSAATRSHPSRLERERRLDMRVPPPEVRPAPVPEQYYLWQNLSEREKQVARLAAQGKRDAEIARDLSISESTVGNHLQRVYAKLKIRSRRELKYILREIVDEPHSPTT